MRFNKKEYLIVDGYNIINAWDELKELAKEKNMEDSFGFYELFEEWIC